MKSIEEIVRHLKAKRPVVWVETYEEDRFLHDFVEMINSANDAEWLQKNPDYAFLGRLGFCDFSIVRGMRKYDFVKGTYELLTEESPTGKQMPISDPLKAMQHIEKKQSEDESEACVYVMKDFHASLTSPSIIRAIRDVKESNSLRYIPLIILSPMVEIPTELEKLVTVVTYELPTAEEIKELVLDGIESIKEMNEQMISKNMPESILYPVPDDNMVKILVRSCAGLTRNEIMSVFRHSLINYKMLSPDAITDEKIQLIKKSGVLDFKLPTAKFEDVGGNKTFKDWIEEIESLFSEESREFGLPGPKGYLAIGVPGSAKTFTAEALANKFDMPFLKFNVARIFDRLVGSSERNAEQAFRTARACAPCVLLVDEIEKVMGGAGSSSNASDAGTTNRVFSQLLQLLEEDNDVFVVLTSNDMSDMHSSLTRSGRIDNSWYFGFPTMEERKEIFSIHLKKTGKDFAQKTLELAAKETHGYTGAEIEQISKIALRKCFQRYLKDKEAPIINEKDIMAAISEIIPLSVSAKHEIADLESKTKDVKKASEEAAVARRTRRDDQMINDYLKLEQ